jgi:hypothetical protein
MRESSNTLVALLQLHMSSFESHSEHATYNGHAPRFWSQSVDVFKHIVALQIHMKYFDIIGLSISSS